MIPETDLLGAPNAAPRAVRGLAKAQARTVIADPTRRQADDFYPTPPEPTVALMASSEGARIRSFDLVWEPAAGDGAMAADLRACGVERVVMSDLVDRGAGAAVRSFYDWREAPASCLVTNPPYSETSSRGKARWQWHARRLGVTYMALLLPAVWPHAAGHDALLRAWPLARIHALRWRVDWTGEGASPMSMAWFVWDSTHRGPTEWHPLDRPGEAAA
jgi:hypothetical protein